MQTHSVHTECIPRRDASLEEEAVVIALRTLADSVEAGIPLEEIRARFDLHTRYHDIERNVVYEVRDCLIQCRDHGTLKDRVENGKGNVPWPVEYLPPGNTPEGYFDIMRPI